MSSNKIIAREGLIILALYALCAAVEIIRLFISNLLSTIDISDIPYDYLGVLANITTCFIFAYIIHWVIRFTIWAIKTLKEK